jgi:hypothetical protein
LRVGAVEDRLRGAGRSEIEIRAALDRLAKLQRQQVEATGVGPDDLPRQQPPQR